MEKETSIATEVFQLMKKDFRKIYLLLYVFIALFVLSLVDSVYQRCRLIKVIREYENMITHEICENVKEKG